VGSHIKPPRRKRSGRTCSVLPVAIGQSGSQQRQPTLLESDPESAGETARSPCRSRRIDRPWTAVISRRLDRSAVAVADGRRSSDGPTGSPPHRLGAIATDRVWWAGRRDGDRGGLVRNPTASASVLCASVDSWAA